MVAMQASSAWGEDGAITDRQRAEGVLCAGGHAGLRGVERALDQRGHKLSKVARKPHVLARIGHIGDLNLALAVCKLVPHHQIDGSSTMDLQHRSPRRGPLARKL